MTTAQGAELSARRAISGRPVLPVVLGLAALVAWALLPSAPNYDTATHLVWARELLAGRAPDVAAIAAPTPHPLWLLLAVLGTAVGAGPALLQLLALVGLAVVVGCAWRLGELLAGRGAGALAAVAVASSFALLLLAFKAYVDLPFLALALTAVLREARAEQAGRDGSRGATILLLAAGLLRPEAWLLGGVLLLLRLLRGVPLRGLLGPGLVILAAPLLWSVADLALTGDPLHSLTGTQALAAELERETGLAATPRALVLQLGDLARPPVAAAGLVGLVVVLLRTGLRPAVLIVLAPFATGLATFVAAGVLGLPLLQRYLLMPFALLGVLAGVAGALLIAAARGRRGPEAGLLSVDGGLRAAEPAGRRAGLVAESDRFAASSGGTSAAATASADSGSQGAAAGQEPRRRGSGPSGPLRLAAAAVLAVGVLGSVGYVALKAGSFQRLGAGVLREARWQREATELVERPEVRAALRCGPVTLPTYRLMPEIQLRTGLEPGQVVSRATQLGGAGSQPFGIALVVAGSREARQRAGWAAGVPRTTNAVPPGFRIIAEQGPFQAAVRCPSR